ncbi:MAG TPA: rhomboid family protein [Planctomycetota bacterium]|nr:rhomboid family protein [Planctomycetota bacterium]
MARCPECTKFFCRECVTEHKERIICAMCLKALTVKSAPEKQRSYNAVIRAGQYLAGVILLWLSFYCIGSMLLSLPESFHDGTLWRSKWWEE